MENQVEIRMIPIGDGFMVDFESEYGLVKRLLAQIPISPRIVRVARLVYKNHSRSLIRVWPSVEWGHEFEDLPIESNDANDRT